MTADQILPSNSTPLERSMLRGLADDLPVPITDIVDPDQTPVAFLPWLAHHESVDLWYEDWSEARKRAMIAEAPTIAWLKGTRQGAIRFLTYVDATVERVIAYPARFVFGRARIGLTPIGHPPFVARYLVKIDTLTPPGAMVMTRSVIGRHMLKTPSREKFNRAMAALRASKAPETQYRVSFSYKRPLRIEDAPRLDSGWRLGDYVSTKTGIPAT